MSPLPEIVEKTISKIQDLEYKLKATPEQQQELFQLRRELQLGYHDHLKQGTRIKLTKELTLECPECNKPMMDSDHIYLHLRQDHGATEEEAAEQSTAATRKHTDDVLQLGALLSEYTEVQLEDDFS